MTNDKWRWPFGGGYTYKIDQRVTSNNQTGGITAHTVNIQVQHRRMTPEAKNAIARGIAGTSGSVLILILTGVGDAGELAADFQEAFTGGGWTIGGSGVAFASELRRGFLLQPHTEAGLKAAHAIQAAGIPSAVGPLTTGGDEFTPDLTITIGLA